MRFPPYLFGLPMTVGIWYVIIVLAGLFIFWILTKIFKTIAKDFAGGLVIFALIIIFILVTVNLVSGANALTSNVDTWFNQLFH
ncbi:MAG: hypothetical protein BGO78_10770 [Chloroflexi bacterium 44-23]|nr:MAG: hypothetical protein BGO78_10770 [Chloroflexi bacterium 44-23]